ncbi:hypothetical protein [Streptomyces phyllanthi]|uniref:hypothetical protein n=1 Tax=Streptomyces phyllanthi TaxID=1803180 RepID=UPI0031EEAD0B
MPRGRHRHSPPLHRLLPPSAIAGVSLVCALGPWVFTQPSVLRVSAAVAAATAAVGAAVMRRWDVEAGKRVADLARARASDEWRHEEQVAELETDLEESRELRQKLEHKLRAKRTELAGLRNEHAALLRRYATAETERASALEGRRLLAIEASTEPAPGSARALPAAGTPNEREAAAAAFDEQTTEGQAAEEQAAPGAFSPAGSSLYLAASSALDRLIKGDLAEEATAGKAESVAESAPEGESREDDLPKGDFPNGDSPKGGSPDGGPPDRGSRDGGSPDGGSPDGGSPRSVSAEAAMEQAGSEQTAQADAASAAGADKDGGAEGRAETVHGHERAATGPAVKALTSVSASSALTPAPAAGVASATPRPALPARPSGHFTIPTAVAVVPAAPRRRPAVEGGFDFFGPQKGATAIEDVQNEDLADVVGQEALALHKAESEARFKPADEDARGIGQVIDLTAHDETEQIDVQGLRSAVS